MNAQQTQNLELVLLSDFRRDSKTSPESLFASNVLSNDDFAKVANVFGNLRKDEEVFLQMIGQFNSPEYIAQAKGFAKLFNPNVKFLDESKTITVERILAEMLKYYNLLDEEIEAFKKYPDALLNIYVDVKEKQVAEIPSSYDYARNRSDYPFIQLWETLYELQKN